MRLRAPISRHALAVLCLLTAGQVAVARQHLSLNHGWRFAHVADAAATALFDDAS